MIRSFILSFLIALLALESAWSLEHVALKRSGKTIQVSGKVLVEAQDGGLLLCGLDGVLWMIGPDEIVSHKSDAQPFKSLDAEQISERLLKEMPDGFKIHRTAHYVICYNTSAAYAQWCGALYERLFRGFYTYWENLGIKLDEPKLPLVALVFDGKDSFARFARRELNSDVGGMIGYYNLETNRVNMYDLTGVEGLKRPRGRISSAARVNHILSQPAAAPTVATIVHEATHQLSYNSGLQVRYAANPFWVSEGMAVYFETPDLKNSKGWRGIGSINRPRLFQFKKYLSARPPNSLLTLIANDKRFHEPAAIANSYAEAWALNYYLFKTRKDDYVAYLKKLAQKTPLIEDTAEERIAEFKVYFGDDLDKFDSGFVKYMRERR